MAAEAREAYRREQPGRALDLRAWWFAEMLETPSPLTEKLTLFWHGHFVSVQQKVRIAHLMYRQNQVLRRHALGNFRTLLHAIAHDPVMMIYLDTSGSRSEAASENFAREVMELFTLGEGHYTERDIKEAARALTGWAVNRDSGEVVFRPRQYDGGLKTIFGKSGRYDMDAMLDLLLEKPDVSEFIVDKFWKAFVPPAPDPAEIRRLASVFRNTDYEIKPLLRAILTGDAFYAEANRGVLVKSPVGLPVGTLREFRFQVNEAAPPAVPIDARIPPRASGGVNGFAEFDSDGWLGSFRANPDGGRQLSEALVPLPPVQVRSVTPTLAGIRQLVLDPSYQLK